MKFLIIDDNAKSRARLQDLVQKCRPDAEVQLWNPVTDGMPVINSRWADYDLLLLDYDLKVANGLDWYELCKNEPHFPPVILLSTSADPDIAVRAIKAGAENYLPKRGLEQQKLNEIVDDILSGAHNQSHVANRPGSMTAAAHDDEDIATETAPDAGIEPDDLDFTPAAESADSGHESAFDANDETIVEGMLPETEVEQKKKAERIRHVRKRRGSTALPQIEGHTVLKKIGQGGMSAIYLAKRESDGEEVVVKTLQVGMIENKKTVIRSHQEFKLISRIENRHIVKLYDHSTVGELLYTTMEYFPNGDLKQRLRKGMLQKHALAYIRQIAIGLSAIHGCGIIHRDLKPGNIMFREDDSLAIIDFGISRDINSKMQLTEFGQIMGTPNYMAPEQGNSSYRPDARSDLYSLGVLLYEMLTGNKPYAAPTGAAIIYKHLHDPIPQLPNRFYDMQILIDRLMAKFPQDRIQSAYELLQFLDTEFRLDLALDFE